MYFSQLILDDLVDYLIDAQVNPATVKKQIERIRKKESLGKGLISYQGISDALVFSYNQTQDDFIGLHLGERITLKVKSQVDEIMMTGRTLKDAFEDAVKYSKMISDALGSHISTTRESLTLWFTIHPEWLLQPPYAVRQIIDVTLVCASNSIHMLSGKSENAYQVSFNYAKPRNTVEYYRIFNSSVHFNQPNPAIEFSSGIFNRKTLNANSGLLAQLKHNAEEQLAKLPNEKGIITQIKAEVLNNLPERLKLEQMANTLNKSSRTIQRHLLEEETSYKKIEKDVLVRLAKNMIAKNENISEISYLLGFSEPSSFVRFFRQATQLTPGQFRQSINN